MTGGPEPYRDRAVTAGGPDELIDGFRNLTAHLTALRGEQVRGENLRGPQSDRRRVPVTLLTGFLGSGKTTVLRHILGADHGLRVSAIVNDLGSLNIDAELLSDGAGSTTSVARFDLTNGCACCELNADLAEALSAAVDGDPNPDAVIVEASGAADPVSMAAIIEGSNRVRLDGIVCVVDAERWRRQLDHVVLGRLAARQLEAAHLVLLAKSDLVTDQQRRSVTESIAHTAPGRQVIPMVDGSVDPAVVLGAAALGAALRPRPEAHEVPVLTETVTIDRPVDRAALGAWLEVGRHGLLRAKGWLRDAEHQLLELQVVGRRWTLTPVTTEHPSSVVLMAADRRSLRTAAGAIGAATLADAAMGGQGTGSRSGR